MNAIAFSDSNSKIAIRPAPSDDPVLRQLDIALLKSVQYWGPTIEIEQGLVMTIDYFKQSLQG